MPNYLVPKKTAVVNPLFTHQSYNDRKQIWLRLCDARHTMAFGIEASSLGPWGLTY